VIQNEACTEQRIHEYRHPRGSSTQGEAAVSARDVQPVQPPIAECLWIEIEDGSGIYNTCKEGEEWHVPEGLEPFPHCHWCGKKIAIYNDKDYPDDTI
jgi:hypothetical protein